jgi:hypothetical protein
MVGSKVSVTVVLLKKSERKDTLAARRALR